MQETNNNCDYKITLRERILVTSMNLFIANGIKAVKMDDIANKLGISKRTVYEIYRDKEEILFEGVKRLRKEHEEEIQKATDNMANVMEIILFVYHNKIERIRLTNPAFYSDLTKYPAVMDYFDKENERLRDGMLIFFERGVREGYFREDVNFEIVNHMFEAMNTHAVRGHLYEKFPLEELFRNLVFILLRGFCTRKGVDELDKVIK